MAKIKATVTVAKGIANDDPRVINAAQQALDRISGTPVRGVKLTTGMDTGNGSRRLYFEGTGKPHGEGAKETPTPTEDKPTPMEDSPTPVRPEEGAWPHPAPDSPHTSDSVKPSSDETAEPE